MSFVSFVPARHVTTSLVAVTHSTTAIAAGTAGIECRVRLRGTPFPPVVPPTRIRTHAKLRPLKVSNGPKIDKRATKTPSFSKFLTDPLFHGGEKSIFCLVFRNLLGNTNSSFRNEFGLIILLFRRFSGRTRCLISGINPSPHRLEK